MAAKNDITGDSIQTRGVSDAYRDNYDLIFGKKKKSRVEEIQDLYKASEELEKEIRDGRNED